MPPISVHRKSSVTELLSLEIVGHLHCHSFERQNDCCFYVLCSHIENENNSKTYEDQYITKGRFVYCKHNFCMQSLSEYFANRDHRSQPWQQAKSTVNYQIVHANQAGRHTMIQIGTLRTPILRVQNCSWNKVS